MRKILAIPPALQHVGFVSSSIFAQLELAAIGAKFKKRPGCKCIHNHRHITCSMSKRYKF